MKRRFLLLAACMLLICMGCGTETETKPHADFESYAPYIDGDDVTIPERRVTTCIRCHGNGVCTHCDGDAFRDGRRCRSCNGTGDCDACGGYGTIEVFELNGKDYTVCTSCHGDAKCGACDGTGRIVQQYSTLGRVDGDCLLCHGSGNCLACRGTGMTELRGF